MQLKVPVSVKKHCQELDKQRQLELKPNFKSDERKLEEKHENRKIAQKYQFLAQKAKLCRVAYYFFAVVFRSIKPCQKVTSNSLNFHVVSENKTKH